MRSGESGENKPAVSPSHIRRSECNGCRGVHIGEIDGMLPAFRLVINTVPALVLDKIRLGRLPKDVLILDLASKPGGDDAEALSASYTI